MYEGGGQLAHHRDHGGHFVIGDKLSPLRIPIFHLGRTQNQPQPRKVQILPHDARPTFGQRQFALLGAARMLPQIQPAGFDKGCARRIVRRIAHIGEHHRERDRPQDIAQADPGRAIGERGEFGIDQRTLRRARVVPSRAFGCVLSSSISSRLFTFNHGCSGSPPNASLYFSTSSRWISAFGDVLGF